MKMVQWEPEGPSRPYISAMEADTVGDYSSASSPDKLVMCHQGINKQKSNTNLTNKNKPPRNQDRPEVVETKLREAEGHASSEHPFQPRRKQALCYSEDLSAANTHFPSWKCNQNGVSEPARAGEQDSFEQERKNLWRLYFNRSGNLRNLLIASTIRQ